MTLDKTQIGFKNFVEKVDTKMNNLDSKIDNKISVTYENETLTVNLRS